MSERQIARRASPPCTGLEGAKLILRVGVDGEDALDREDHDLGLGLVMS